MIHTSKLSAEALYMPVEVLLLRAGVLVRACAGQGRSHEDDHMRTGCCTGWVSAKPTAASSPCVEDSSNVYDYALMLPAQQGGTGTDHIPRRHHGNLTDAEAHPTRERSATRSRRPAPRPPRCTARWRARRGCRGPSRLDPLCRQKRARWRTHPSGPAKQLLCMKMTISAIQVSPGLRKKYGNQPYASASAFASSAAGILARLQSELYQILARMKPSAKDGPQRR